MNQISIKEFNASASLLRRIRLMATFIATRHAAEFEAYWAENWIGNAEAKDALDFFKTYEFTENHVISRVER